jgi:hypothetical protein
MALARAGTMDHKTQQRIHLQHNNSDTLFIYLFGDAVSVSRRHEAEIRIQAAMDHDKHNKGILSIDAMECNGGWDSNNWW